MPFGQDRSSFNPKLRERFINFVTVIQEKSITFYSSDFRKIFSDIIPSFTNPFAYCDPPYYNSAATYNNGWTDICEKDLLKTLDNY